MVEDVHIFGSRRSYEFAQDQLRVSMITAVRGYLKDVLHFENVAVGTPGATAGEVPVTFPPGLAFQLGVWKASTESLVVPIRFVNIEPRRIVVDVAGRSEDAAAVYAFLVERMQDLKAADGFPAIGQAASVLDYSEVSCRLSADPSAFIPPALRDLYAGLPGMSSSDGSVILAPMVSLNLARTGQEYAGGPYPGRPGDYHLAIRAGTVPEARTYFSAAPLSSEDHIKYLNALDAALQRAGADGAIVPAQH